MRQLLRANLLHSDSELLHHLVDDETLNQIKGAGDPSPKINIYSIGHEGTATPNRVTPQGPKRIRIKYLKDAIFKIAKALPKWTPAFFRHGRTNEHTGREVVGQIVGTTVKKIGGVLHTLAAVHVFPPHRDKKMDVASIEADCAYGVGDDGAVQMKEVHKVSAVALGDGDVDTPAFPGATLRGAFQCFAGTLQFNDRGEKKMDREELKQALRDANFAPTEIFSEDALKQAGLVKAQAPPAPPASPKAEETPPQLSELVTQMAEMKTQLQAAEDGRKAAESKLAGLEKTALQNRAQPLLQGLAEERKLEAPAIAFAVSGLGEFQSDAADESTLKTHLNTFLDQKIAQRDKWLEAEGIKQQQQTPPDGDKPASTPFSPAPDGAGDKVQVSPVVSKDNEFAVDYRQKLKEAIGV